MDVSTAFVTNIVIGVAVLAFVVYRQLAVRRVRENYRLIIILAIIGIVQFSRFLSSNGHAISGGRIAITLAGSAVLAAALGFLRAITVKIWRGPEGQLLRRGTWLTAVLWVVAVAAHLGFDALVAGGFGTKNASIGDATILLYLAVSFGVQQAVLLNRAQRQDAGGNIPAGEPQAPVS